MKAVQILGPQKIEVVELPKPIPGEKDILIRVKAVGLCGTDLELLRGEMPYIQQGFTTYPIIPGHEWSGIIEETGDEVKEFIPGDRVTGDVSIGCGECDYCKKGRFNLCANRYEVGSYRNKDGAYAEYILMPAKHVYKLPENVTLEEAALCEPAATAAYSVVKSGVGFGDTVLTIGDGPIGQLSMQCAKAVGAGKVILVGSWPEKMQIALNTGADQVISYRNEDVVKKVLDITNGKGVDVVIENSGNPEAIEQSIKSVKMGGKIVLVSIYGKGKVPVDIDSVIINDVDIYGVLASPNTFAGTLALMGAGKINVKPLITHQFPLEEIKKAIQLVYERKEFRIKILLKP